MKRKSEFRKIGKQLRESEFKTLGNECISTRKFKNLIKKLNVTQTSLNVAIYYPIGTEVSPLKLISISEEFKFEICLPVIMPNKNFLVFNKYKPSYDLMENFYGIPEPKLKSININPDIIFVPMLGFDKQLNRLGYGKGFYDRTISKLRKFKNIFVIGIAYDNQLLKDVPVEDHDQKMDFILTEKKIYRAENFLK